MMRLIEVVNHLSKIFDPKYLEKGDNSGLLVGSLTQEITHIRTALEASDRVIDQAIHDGVDLLIVHHPLIYMPILNIRDDQSLGRKLMKLVKSGVALYAAHSNLDRMPGGLNESFGRLMGLQAQEVHPSIGEGYIQIGTLTDQMTLREFGHRLSVLLKQPIRYVGRPEAMINRVAFCTGSGMSLLDDTLFCEADVYLTGDIKYHDAMAVFEQNHCLIDITHYGSEIHAGQVLYGLIKNTFCDLTLSVDDTLTDPFRMTD